LDFTSDVPPKTSHRVAVSHTSHENLTSYICISEVFPADRKDMVSASFEVRTKVVQSGYTSRERPRLDQDGDAYILNMGSHALYTRVWEASGWKTYTKKTLIEITDPQDLRAYSESHNMRFNYFGW